MAYIGTTPTKVVSRQSVVDYRYTATAGQTAFTGADLNNQVLACNPADMDVRLNGVTLDLTDWTATATTLTLAVAATAGDEVTVAVRQTFEVADTYAKTTADDRFVNAAGDTVSGALAVTGDLTVDTNTLYVDSTNNRVGVGTSSPSGPLQVAGGRIKSGLLGSSDTSNIGGIDLYATTDNSDRRNWSIRPESTYTGTLGFWVSGANNSEPSSQVVSIHASGNVGIGTSLPFGTASGRTVLSLNNTADNRIGFGVSGTERQYLYGDATNFSIINTQSGYVRFSTANTERMRISSNGAKNHNYDTAADPKETFNWSNNTTGMSFRSAGIQRGSIYFLDSGVSYNTTSDYRLKEDLRPVDSPVDRVLALKPVNFAWTESGIRVDGFLAHEAQAVVPEAVTGTKDAMRTEEYEVTPAVEATYDEDGNELTPYVPAVMGTREVPDYQGIDQSKLVPLLTAALQEALSEITDLKARVAALETKP